MKKSLRWGAAVAIATAATMTLASCGFSGGSGGSASGGAQSLDLMVASYSDNTKAEWQQIIKDFEAKNSGITVNLDVESWTDINNVIKTKVAAGKQPDILNIDAFAGFAADDLLYPAKDIVSAKTLDDFQTAFKDNASIDGTQYGLPFIASARALFYNKDAVLEGRHHRRRPRPGPSSRPTPRSSRPPEPPGTACRSEAKRRRPRPRSGSTEPAAATATPRS